jgi:hypothetical protein
MNQRGGGSAGPVRDIEPEPAIVVGRDADELGTGGKHRDGAFFAGNLVTFARSFLGLAAEFDIEITQFRHPADQQPSILGRAQADMLQFRRPGARRLEQFGASQHNFLPRRYGQRQVLERTETGGVVRRRVERKQPPEDHRHRAQPEAQAHQDGKD